MVELVATIPSEQLPQRPWMDREIVYQKYVVEGKNLNAVAKELGCGFGTIQRCMVGLGIPARQTRKPLVPRNPYNNEEWLRDAHIVQNKSLTRIAQEIGVNFTTLRKWFKAHGVPIRGNGERFEEGPKAYWQNKGWLHENYVVQRKETTTLAGEIGCYPTSITRWLRRVGIEVRKGGKYAREKHRCNNREWLWNAHIVERRTIVDIAREAGRGTETISRWMGEFDIPVRTNADRMIERIGIGWQNKEWLEQAYAGHRRNTSSLAREIGIDSKSLAKHLERLGISHRTMDEFLDSASFDLSLWSDYSPTMCYVLGYAFADGCVTSGKLTMVSTDRQLLEVVADCTGFVGNILGYESPFANCKQQYILALHDPRLPDILAKYNLVPRKSLIVEMPEGVPLDCIGSFARGVFDGDGCARLQQTGKRKSMHLIFVSGSEKFAHGLQDAINTACGSVGKIIGRIPTGGKCVGNPIYHLEYINAADVIRVSTLMYQDSDGKYLQRKRDKIDEFMKYLTDAITDTYRWNRYDPQTKQLILNMTYEWPTIDNPLELAA